MKEGLVAMFGLVTLFAALASAIYAVVLSLGGEWIRAGFSLIASALFYEASKSAHDYFFDNK